MNSRRNWVGSSILLAAGLLLSGVRQAKSQEGFSVNSAERLRGTRNSVPLIDQLSNGLRVSRPSDRQFLQAIVDRVDQGILPQGMVNLIYRWAIQKNHDVPFPYFQFAMRELSRRRGIILP